MIKLSLKVFIKLIYLLYCRVENRIKVRMNPRYKIYQQYKKVYKIRKV